MPLTLSDMLSDLRTNTGEDLSDLPDDNAILLLNKSYWEILDKFPFREKEATATLVTTAGIKNYEAPQPFEALRQISITDPFSLNHYMLDRWIPNQYESNVSDDPSEYDIPRKYVREGCMFRLWPTPDQAYTLTVKFWAILGNLGTTNPSTPIPQVWDEIIVYGATWRRFLQKRDFAAVGMFKNMQVDLINSTSPVSTKEEADSRSAGVNVRRSDSGAYQSRLYR